MATADDKIRSDYRHLVGFQGGLPEMMQGHLLELFDVDDSHGRQFVVALSNHTLPFLDRVKTLSESVRAAVATLLMYYFSGMAVAALIGKRALEEDGKLSYPNTTCATVAKLSHRSQLHTHSRHYRHSEA